MDKVFLDSIAEPFLWQPRPLSGQLSHLFIDQKFMLGLDYFYVQSNWEPLVMAMAVMTVSISGV